MKDKSTPHWRNIGSYFKKDNVIYQITMYYDDETYGAWSETDEPEHIRISVHKLKLYKSKKKLEPYKPIKGKLRGFETWQSANSRGYNKWPRDYTIHEIEGIDGFVPLHFNKQKEVNSPESIEVILPENELENFNFNFVEREEELEPGVELVTFRRKYYRQFKIEIFE